MRVKIGYTIQCICGEEFPGPNYYDAWSKFIDHRKKHCPRSYKVKRYLINEQGERVEGLNDVLNQLVEDGVILYRD